MIIPNWMESHKNPWFQVTTNQLSFWNSHRVLNLYCYPVCHMVSIWLWVLGCLGSSLVIRDSSWILDGQRVQNCFCLLCQLWIFFCFFSWYHLPCICNSLERESVILHGICCILAWSLCILQAICYSWPCVPPILHGICHMLALQPIIGMVLGTFWYFKRSCRVSFRVSLGVHLGFL